MQRGARRASTRDASSTSSAATRPDDETLIAQLILVALGGVLMLGGTLTATFLALSDARPDLATLSAVGASPRTRRGVAAAYAVVVGLVGAVLGAAVGLHPRHRGHLSADDTELRDDRAGRRRASSRADRSSTCRG